MEIDQKDKFKIRKYLSTVLALLLISSMLLSSQTFKPSEAAPGTNRLFGTNAGIGDLIIIDPTTGAGTLVGNIVPGSIHALAVDPTTGIMYAGRANGNFYQVDPNTAAATLLGDNGLSSGFSAMDFRSDGTLFASINLFGNVASGGDNLAIIDKSTGKATLIGPFGNCFSSCSIEGMEALAFDNSGTLYGATKGTTPKLYTIDTTTGKATFVAKILDKNSLPPGGVFSLQFACDGTLYGGTGTTPQVDGLLITINPTTGLFSVIGMPTSGILGALAFETACTGTLIVIKHVVNDNAGTSQASDFTVHVTGNNPNPANFPGSETGTTVAIHAGSYQVTEDSVTGYTPSLSADCSGTIQIGEQKTCIITNDDIPPNESICSFDPAAQPEDPTSMNVVIGNKGGTPIVKTIHIEKQIFNCKVKQGAIPAVVDVTIIAEIYEDMNTKSIVRKQAEVITCATALDQATVIECSKSSPPADLSLFNTCFELPATHPQEMDSAVNSNGGIVKTVEAQKEVFKCTLGTTQTSDDKKVDLVVFTNIWEDLNKLPLNPVLKKTFLSMRCVIQLNSATVESCEFTKLDV